MKKILFVLGLSAVSAIAAANPIKSTEVFKRVGDLEIKAEVYSYGDDKVRPCVVWFHGGALINGGRQGISSRVRKFAFENGYVLVSFDYRLAPETMLPEIISDLEDGMTWLVRKGPRKFHIDPDRIAVSGGSAGGYMTLTAGFRARHRPRVLLAFWGYGDLVGEWYSKPSPHYRHHRIIVTPEGARAQVSGPPVANSRDRMGNGGVFYVHCRQQGTWPTAVSGWDPHQEPEKFHPYMAVKNVDSNYPPTVMIHGKEDTDVPFEQSAMMAVEFRKHGVEHLLLAIENGEHGLAGADRAEVDAANQRAFDFVKARLER